MSQSAPPSTRRERIIKKLVTLMVKGVYRKVDVFRTADGEGLHPQMSVANHFGGFADPILLIYAMPRVPRIVARDVIWRYPLARSLMNWIRAIPVHKPEDRGPGSNDVMFAAAYEALRGKSHVMIFPEGVTRDEPSIAPVKTGAARIVLGARADGVEGIRIVPAGIHYEDKAALRSAVSIEVGRPLDLDAGIDRYVVSGADPGPDNREAVRELTDDIDRRLREVAPDFADWREAKALTHGAEILLRSLADDPRQPVPLAARDHIAGYLGRRPAEVREQIVDAVSTYEGDLSQLDLTDAQLFSGMTGVRFLRRLIGWLVLSIVLLPFALAGAVINVVPFLIVKAVGLKRMAPAVASTVKPLTAIAAFGLTWGMTVWLVLRKFGIGGAALAILLIPVYLAAVIVFVERVASLWAAYRAWRGLGATTTAEDVITAKRRDIVDVLVGSL